MDSKPWYLSKAVIGAIIAGVAGLLAVFKVGWASGVPSETDSVVAIVEQVAVIVGAVIALYGRLKATTTIK